MVCVCDKHTDVERSRSVGLCNSMMFVFLKWDTIKSYLQYEHCNWLNVFLKHVWSSLDHSTTLVLLIQPVCTSLLFTLLFIKSPYTGFLFFLSYCFALFLFHCTFYSYFTIYMPLCCTSYNLYSYYFALSTERTWFDYISLLIIPRVIYYVTNKETLNLA